MASKASELAERRLPEAIRIASVAFLGITCRCHSLFASTRYHQCEAPLRPEQLYRDHYGRLLAGLIRLTRDVQLAEDALQEAFASAIVQRQSEDPSEAAGWIFSTA